MKQLLATIILTLAIASIAVYAAKEAIPIAKPIAAPEITTFEKIDEANLRVIITREEIIAKRDLLMMKANLEREVAYLQKEIADINAKLAVFSTPTPR